MASQLSLDSSKLYSQILKTVLLMVLVMEEKSVSDGVALLINKDLFRQVQLRTPLQALAARVTLQNTVTFCNS